MMIGIDGNEANVASRVGVGEYAFELLRQFGNLKSQISNLKFRIYLKGKPNIDLPKVGKRWEYHVIGPKAFWTQFALPLDLYFHKPRPNIFFTPTHYGPRFSPVPMVVSVMDLSYIYYPHLFKKGDLYKLKKWTEYSVLKAEKVLTISQASKNDIIKYYKTPQDKIVVTYPGIKGELALVRQNYMDKLKTTYGINEDFILFVGTIQPRKNIVRLIQAYEKLIKEKSFSNLYLVIIGKRGWQYEEILSTPKKLGIDDKVKFQDFVSNDDLPFFYSNARCFVLPSLYEGFGLPILEAMKYGCPVITSKVSSMPEAGGDAALYVDPENVEDILDKIKQVLGDDKLRKDMVEKGKKHVSKFSWEKTAKDTLRVLEEVALKK